MNVEWRGRTGGGGFVYGGKDYLVCKEPDGICICESPFVHSLDVNDEDNIPMRVKNLISKAFRNDIFDDPYSNLDATYAKCNRSCCHNRKHWHLKEAK